MGNNFLITGIDRVIMVGKNEYSQEKLSFSHTLKSNELIFHFSGRTTVFFNDSVLTTEPYTVRFLPKGKPKRYDVLFKEKGECIDVCFQSDKPLSEIAFVQNVTKNEKLPVLFKRLFSTWVSKKDGYYYEAMSMLYRIFAELQRAEYAPKRYEYKLAPALDIIHNDFLRSELPIDTLAAACGMGVSNFQKLFGKTYGVAPKRYIIQLKIEQACEMLRLESYTVTKIAEMCNFSDVYFFSRQFKEYMGITPTQFVKKYKSSK